MFSQRSCAEDRCPAVEEQFVHLLDIRQRDPLGAQGGQGRGAAGDRNEHEIFGTRLIVDFKDLSRPLKLTPIRNGMAAFGDVDSFQPAFLAFITTAPAMKSSPRMVSRASAIGKAPFPIPTTDTGSN